MKNQIKNKVLEAGSITGRDVLGKSEEATLVKFYKSINDNNCRLGNLIERLSIVKDKLDGSEPQGAELAKEIKILGSLNHLEEEINDYAQYLDNLTIYVTYLEQL